MSLTVRSGYGKGSFDRHTCPHDDETHSEQDRSNVDKSLLNFRLGVVGRDTPGWDTRWDPIRWPLGLIESMLLSCYQAILGNSSVRCQVLYWVTKPGARF